MTREEAMAKVKAYNDELNWYKENAMLKDLGVRKGQQLPSAEWFALYNRAYNLLEKYYKMGWAIMEECRAEGFDVKISGVTYELQLH